MSLSKENKVIIDGQTYYSGLNQPNLKFIKVNVDCWEKIFDYLSLRDILAMSQTCQRMRQIGGYYYRQNFRGNVCSFDNKSYFIKYPDSPVDQEDFLRFINDTEIVYSLDRLRSLSSMNLLVSLTTIRLHAVNLNEHQLHGFENVQNKIENIFLVDCSIYDDSVGKFLASCSKLKLLHLNRIRIKSTVAKASLFQRTYPMLKEFQVGMSRKVATSIIPFLERNPSINCLQIEPIDLQVIPLDTSKIQLDYLIIAGCADDTIEIHNRLKAIHSNGFFKKLRVGVLIEVDDFDWKLFVKYMTSFSALEVWGSGLYSNDVCQMTQLKELHLSLKLEDNDNTTPIATNLINLERLKISGAVGQLLPFLCHTKKLKYVLFSGNNRNCTALDLCNLNHLRAVAGMQRTVQIGLYEQQYLATKWKEKNVSYELVEITRYETIHQHFRYKFY